MTGRAGRSRGRGARGTRARGTRARGTRGNSRARRSLNNLFTPESNVPLLHQAEAGPSSGPSSSSLQIHEDLQIIRQQRVVYNKHVRSLSIEDKSRLKQAKRQKEMSRVLLPDAPTSKSRGHPSPERVDPILSSGTPHILPPPMRPPWREGSPILAESIVAVETLRTPTTRFIEGTRTPSTSGSLPSVLDISPSNWRGGVELDIEIETYNGGGVVENILHNDDKDEISNSPTQDLISLDSRLFSRSTAKPQPALNISDAPLSPCVIIVPNASDAAAMVQDESEGSGDDEVPRDAPRIPVAVLSDDVEPSVLNELNIEDVTNDAVLRQIAGPELLNFDWHKDATTFKGVRETFTCATGPTLDMMDIQGPIDVFLKIWDDGILDLIVTETNRYAEQILSSGASLSDNSRLKAWKPTDRAEMLYFFAILMIQSLAPNPVEQDYFKSSGLLAMPSVASLMTYNRFVLLKKFLHFNDSLSMPRVLTQKQRRLYKIQPLIDYLNNKFSSLYNLGQNVAIDESLLQYSGRLGIVQKIATKAAGVGIKSFELCDSVTGYLWQFRIYCGADRTTQENVTDEHTSPTDARQSSTIDRQTATDVQTLDNSNFGPDGSTAKVVYDLASPLFGKGHSLVMDNFYNSPLLARCLKKYKTDVFGTLRLNREFVPESLKSLTKAELRPGEVVFSQTHDLSIAVYRDSNLVAMISTYHPMEIGAKEKFGVWRFKPQVILDYNLVMGGVDKKDQLLSAYPLERVRNQVWYKKLFRRLLNVSILNSYIIYKTTHDNITQRSFRLSLAEALIAKFRPGWVIRPVTKTMVGERPIVSGNHFIGKASTRWQKCVWCTSHRNRSARTSYKCKQCNVALCFDCFEEFHTVP